MSFYRDRKKKKKKKTPVCLEHNVNGWLVI